MRLKHASTKRPSGQTITALLLALALAACSESTPQRSEFYALGTIVSVSTYDSDTARATAAARAIERHLQRRAVDWYAYADGELAAMNTAMQEQQAIDVSPELAAVIRRAGELERRSGGRFHAGLGALMRLWGLHDLDSGMQIRPDDSAILEILQQLDGLASLRWQQNRLQPAALQFDLGGIAKGALLAECADILGEHGIQNAIVNLGGDLLVTGQVAQRDARIGIRSPFHAAPMGALTVFAGEAVMTSGNYERYVEREGVRYTHILDPLTGMPVAHSASVTVVHTDPILADAAATALLVGGPAQFDDLVAAFGLELAMLVSASGDVRLTNAFRQRLNSVLELQR